MHVILSSLAHSSVIKDFYERRDTRVGRASRPIDTLMIRRDSFSYAHCRAANAKPAARVIDTCIMPRRRNLSRPGPFLTYIHARFACDPVDDEERGSSLPGAAATMDATRGERIARRRRHARSANRGAATRRVVRVDRFDPYDRRSEVGRGAAWSRRDDASPRHAATFSATSGRRSAAFGRRETIWTDAAPAYAVRALIPLESNRSNTIAKRRCALRLRRARKHASCAPL